MEEEPVMVAPDVDMLQQQQQAVNEEQLVVPEEETTSSSTLRSPSSPEDEFSLDDITATPREKTREEIIAEAEEAAFAEQ
jgi:ribonuclease-3